MNIVRVLLGFVLIGVLSRLLPHPPNFTSLNAIALFSAYHLGSRSLSAATLFLTLFLSDLILGYHTTLPYVYLSFGLIILAGYHFRNRLALPQLLSLSAGSSFLFYLITNFGSWMSSSLYPKTLYGLGLCYLAAIPFLLNQVLGDLAYGLILYGMLHLLAEKPLKGNI